jgi:hypothetical protein
MDASDITSEVTGPLPPNVVKVLERAEELGWFQNPFTSLVVRLSRDDAEPFYARWDMYVSPEGKRSWRFKHARAKNAQPLNYKDIFTYLEDPSVIYPEPPTEDEELASAYDAWQKGEGNVRPDRDSGDNA